MAKHVREQSLSQKQVAVVTGSILGDGHLVKTTRGFAFRVNHGLSQDDYVQWKYDVMKDFVRTAPKKFNNSVYFRTVSHPSFDELRQLFYQDQKKVVRGEAIQRFLDPIVLAVWIMDDGSRDGNCLRINSQGFSKEENELLIRFLRAKLGISSSLNRDKSYWRIRIRAESMNNLVQLVRPHFVPSMLYKLPL